VNSAALKLDHDKFSLDILDGTVKDTNMWSESHTSGGGGGGLSIDGTGASHHKKIRTKIKNKREFWLEDESGKEYHFIVNADRISVRKEQPLKILAAFHKNITEAVLILNTKEEKVFTNHGKMYLVFNEAPLLNIALILASFLGIFFMHSALLSAIHIGIVLFTAMRWMSRLAYYKQKLKDIENAHFQKESS